MLTTCVALTMLGFWLTRKVSEDAYFAWYVLIYINLSCCTKPYGIPVISLLGDCKLPPEVYYVRADSQTRYAIALLASLNYRSMSIANESGNSNVFYSTSSILWREMDAPA
jgi:hypothetical protein